eukprot:scaffold179482_cov40-Tisochrysis_lutea.AAC.4
MPCDVSRPRHRIHLNPLSRNSLCSPRMLLEKSASPPWLRIAGRYSCSGGKSVAMPADPANKGASRSDGAPSAPSRTLSYSAGVPGCAEPGPCPNTVDATELETAASAVLNRPLPAGAWHQLELRKGQIQQLSVR